MLRVTLVLAASGGASDGGWTDGVSGGEGLLAVLQDGGHQASEGHVQHLGHGPSQEVNIHGAVVNESVQGRQVAPSITLRLEILYNVTLFMINI